MIITVKLLKAERACASQVAIFASLFPGGMPVTRANLQRCAVARLDLDWAAGHLLPRAARDAYYVALKPLDAAYYAARKPFYDAYYAARKPFYDAYEAARKPIDDAYDAARKPFYDAYLAARQPLADAYYAACKPLDDAYDAARADALYEAARDAGMTEEE